MLAAPLVQQPQLGGKLGIGRLFHLPRNQGYGLIGRALGHVELGQLQLSVGVLGLGWADGLQHPTRWCAAPGLPVAAAQHQGGQPAHVFVGALGQNLFVERVALLVAQAGDLQQGAAGQLRGGLPPYHLLKLGQGCGRVA